VAYIARTGDKWAVVLDGIADKPYEAVSGPGLFFSPDSRHLAYIADLGVKKAFVVDGAEGKHYDSFHTLKNGFDSPNTYHYVVSRQHDATSDVVLVEGTIPACLEAACSGTQNAQPAQKVDTTVQSSTTAAAAPNQPSVPPALATTASAAVSAPARTAKVILIGPQVRLEDMVTGRVLNPAQFKSAAFQL
jgi:hypothetical protein